MNGYFGTLYGIFIPNLLLMRCWNIYAIFMPKPLLKGVWSIICYLLSPNCYQWDIKTYYAAYYSQTCLKRRLKGPKRVVSYDKWSLNLGVLQFKKKLFWGSEMVVSFNRWSLRSG